MNFGIKRFQPLKKRLTEGQRRRRISRIAVRLTMARLRRLHERGIVVAGYDRLIIEP